MPVQDIDRGWDALSKQLEQLQGDPYVLIGVQGAQAAAQHPPPPDAEDAELVTHAQVASWNEFGTGHIPERSFIRQTIDKNRAPILALAGKFGTAILDGRMSGARALGLLGEHTRGLMVGRISARDFKRNADSTIARKGSDTPLIAFHNAIAGSITYRLGSGQGGG